MSDVALGAGWWVAADGKWHPPELRPPGVQPEIVASEPDATAPDSDQLHDGTGEIASATTDAPASGTAGTATGAVHHVDDHAAGTDGAASAVAPTAESEPAHPVQSAAATPIAPVRLVDTVRPVRVPPGPPPLPPEVSPFPPPPRLDEFLASKGTADPVADVDADISEPVGTARAEPVSPDVTAAGTDGGTPVDGVVEGDGVLDFLADFAPAEPSGFESPITDVDDASGVAVPGPTGGTGVEHPVVAEAEAVVGAGQADDLFDDEDDSLSIHSLLFGGEADGAGPELDGAGADVLDAPVPFEAEPDTIAQGGPQLSPGMVAAVPEPMAETVVVAETVVEPVLAAAPVADVAPEPLAEAVPVVEVEPEPEPVAAAAPVTPAVQAEPEPVAADAAAPQQVAAATEPEPADEDEAETDGSETVAASATARPARAGSAARPARPGAARQAPLVKGGPEFKDIFKMAMNGNSLADSVQVKYDAGSERGRVTSGSPPADDDSKRRRRKR